MRASSGGRSAVDLLPPIDLPADEIFSPDFGSKPGDSAVDRQRLRVDVNAPASPERTGFRTQSSSSIGDENHDLLPLWGSLPRIPRDQLDAGLPGLERTKQGGGRRSDRGQHTAIIREHAGREDPQQLDGRSAFQKVPAGCPNINTSPTRTCSTGGDLARLDLDKVGQSVTAPVPRPLPRPPMPTILRRHPSQPELTEHPQTPSGRSARRTYSRSR